MIYIFGVPTAVAAGSELFLAMFMGAFGAINYAFAGFVDPSCCSPLSWIPVWNLYWRLWY